jgi:prephenate dehydratase
MNKVRVGLSGGLGSFSEEAALIYVAKNKKEEYQLNYLIDMENVLKELNHNNIDIGVFPYFNNNSGIVKQAFAAMGKYAFSVIDSISLNINQCLIAKQALDIANISTIYSFEPALKQCKNFIANQFKGVKIIDWGDMAEAARAMSLDQFAENTAVIGSKRSAQIFKLTILRENIQDNQNNLTEFVVVKLK